MTVSRSVLAIVCAALVALGPLLATPAASQAPAPPKAPPPATGAPSGALGETQTGLAAYYSDRLNGRRTASGERYNRNALTTAHQTLPFGALIKVTNTKNNRSVVLRVNDRGPTQQGRILDVSKRAARTLGFVQEGLVEVKIEVVQVAKPKRGKV